MARVGMCVAGAFACGLAMGGAALGENATGRPSLAPVERASMGAGTPAGRSERSVDLSATVAGVASAPVPACARKVKVIYAGYGEADRASCNVASAAPGR